MDVGLHSIQVALEHIHFSDRDLLAVTLNTTNGHNRFIVLSLVKAGHITRVEDSVDILKLVLVNDLGVDEEEGGGLSLDTTDHEDGLQILAPISH
jgi:hypothetical protein